MGFTLLITTTLLFVFTAVEAEPSCTSSGNDLLTGHPSIAAFVICIPG